MSVKVIPEELLAEYTINGNVKIHDLYIGISGTRMFMNYSFGNVEKFIDIVKKRETLHYEETDGWLYQAMDKYSVANQHILVIGSEEPCYEAVAIAYGADNVTMVEYQKVTSQHPKLKTMTVSEFENDDNLFDASISISSVEHSGLGRYGDELDPNGDIKAMKVLLDKTRVGGLCFLAVPMGKDEILWNAHRVYGRIRFNRLIDGWEIVESFGFIDSDFDVSEALKRDNGKIPHREGVSGGAHQPVFVLRKK